MLKERCVYLARHATYSATHYELNEQVEAEMNYARVSLASFEALALCQHLMYPQNPVMDLSETKGLAVHLQTPTYPQNSRKSFSETKEISGARPLTFHQNQYDFSGTKEFAGQVKYEN